MRAMTNQGLSWDGDRSKRVAILLVILSLIGATLTVAVPLTDGSETISVIILKKAGANGSVLSHVESLGGTVTHEYGIIDGLSADVPAHAVASIQKHPDVSTVTPDYPVTLASLTED